MAPRRTPDLSNQSPTPASGTVAQATSSSVKPGRTAKLPTPNSRSVAAAAAASPGPLSVQNANAASALTTDDSNQTNNSNNNSAGSGPSSGSGQEAPSDPNVPRSAISNSPHAKRLASTFRTTKKSFYTVDEMARAIDEELDGATFLFRGTEFIRRLFPKSLIPVNFELRDLRIFLDRNSGHRPSYLEEFFKSFSVAPPSPDSGKSAGKGIPIPKSTGGGPDESFVTKPPSEPSSVYSDYSLEFALEESFASDEVKSDDSDDSDYVGTDDSVNESEDSYSETKDEESYQEWFNHIGYSLDKLAGFSSERRFTADHRDLSMKGVTPEKRKPDLILIPGSSPNPVSNGDWGSVYTVIEISRAVDFPARLMKECSQRATLILHNSPGRRYVPIVAISGRQFMILVYHRSGVTHSQKYDLVKNCTGFYYILLALFFAKPEALGFDPSITLGYYLEPKEIQFGGVRYKIISILYAREGIQGRGTVCFEVLCLTTMRRLMFKFSWVNLKRKYKEIEFYEETRKHKVVGVPILIAWEDSVVSGRTDDTSQWMPSGKSDVFLVRTCRKILLDGVGRPILHFRSKKELLSAIIDIVEAHYRLVLIGILHRDMSLWNLFLVDSYPEYPSLSQASTEKQKSISSTASNPPSSNSPQPTSSKKPEVPQTSYLSELHRMTRNFSSMLLPNSSLDAGDLESMRFSSSSESTGSSSTVVVTPLRGPSPIASSALEATPNVTPRPLASQISSNSLSVLEHGDIFGPTHIARGLLSDFDYATFMLSRSEGKRDVDGKPLTEIQKRNRMRTGTMPFMAIEVLLGSTVDEDFLHTYQHDFESLVYDLMAICMCQGGPNNQKRDFDSVPIPVVYDGKARLPTDHWMLRDMTWVELGFQKLSTWAHLETWVIPCFHPYFNDMKDMFVEIAEAFWPEPPETVLADYNRRVNSKISYETFLTILKKYRDKVRG